MRLSCFRAALAYKCAIMEQSLDILVIRAENNTYVSQLTLSVSAEIIGTTISCFLDSGATENLVGSSLLALTRGTTS